MAGTLFTLESGDSTWYVDDRRLGKWRIPAKSGVCEILNGSWQPAIEVANVAFREFRKEHGLTE
jgi:hypothetical protein